MRCQSSPRGGEADKGLLFSKALFENTVPCRCSDFYSELRRRVEKYFKDNNIVSDFNYTHQ